MSTVPLDPGILRRLLWKHEIPGHRSPMSRQRLRFHAWLCPLFYAVVTNSSVIAQPFIMESLNERYYEANIGWRV